MSPDTALRRAVGPILAAGVGAVAWGTLVERHWFALRHRTVPALRRDATGTLRLLHVSDMHLLPGQERKIRFVRDAIAQRPDLVVCTGDVLGHPDVIADATRALALPAGMPGLLVRGSNDFYGPTFKNPFSYLIGPAQDPDHPLGAPLDAEGLATALGAVGWRLIDNTRAPVSTSAGLVDVAGLADPHIGYDRPDDVDWSAEAHGGGPGEAVALRLGVVHAPYRAALDRFDRYGFDLALAGHTHGGQVRLPGVGALVANCDLPLGAVRGLSRHGAELWLHVSAGLGHARHAPFRFACRPEATLLDVVKPG